MVTTKKWDSVSFFNDFADNSNLFCKSFTANLFYCTQLRVLRIFKQYQALFKLVGQILENILQNNFLSAMTISKHFGTRKCCQFIPRHEFCEFFNPGNFIEEGVR